MTWNYNIDEAPKDEEIVIIHCLGKHWITTSDIVEFCKLEDNSDYFDGEHGGYSPKYIIAWQYLPKRSDKEQ